MTQFAAALSEHPVPSAATGEVIWEFVGAGKVYSKPAIAGDLLYFGSGDHFLYALDPKTGEERWRFEAQAMVCNPVVNDGKVYFGSGNAHFHILTA